MHGSHISSPQYAPPRANRALTQTEGTRHPDVLDYEAIAGDLVRALRGTRSQEAFRRRLGYRGNVAYRWETGVCHPSASTFFAAARKLGCDLDGALEEFLPAHPSWLGTHGIDTGPGVAAFLEHLRGSLTVQELATRAERSRFAVARWLKGQSEPRLPDFLRIVHAATFRMPDFVATLADPANLPSLAPIWRSLEAARTATYEVPWSHAVLRAIELDGYRALKEHDSGWIGERVGLPVAEVDRCLTLLVTAGQIRKRGKRYQIADAPYVLDTSRNPQGSRAVRAYWLRTASERFERGAQGTFGFNVFAITDEGLEQLRALHVAYFREMQRLIAASPGGDRVALFATQLFSLEEGAATASSSELATPAIAKPTRGRATRARTSRGNEGAPRSGRRAR